MGRCRKPAASLWRWPTTWAAVQSQLPKRCSQRLPRGKCNPGQLFAVKAVDLPQSWMSVYNRPARAVRCTFRFRHHHSWSAHVLCADLGRKLSGMVQTAVGSADGASSCSPAVTFLAAFVVPDRAVTVQHACTCSGQWWHWQPEWRAPAGGGPPATLLVTRARPCTGFRVLPSAALLQEAGRAGRGAAGRGRHDAMWAVALPPLGAGPALEVQNARSATARGAA